MHLLSMKLENKNPWQIIKPCLCYENLHPQRKQLPCPFCVRKCSKRHSDEKLDEVSEREDKIENFAQPTLTPTVLSEILPGNQIMLPLLPAGKLQEKHCKCSSQQLLFPIAAITINNSWAFSPLCINVKLFEIKFTDKYLIYCINQ